MGMASYDGTFCFSPLQLLRSITAYGVFFSWTQIKPKKNKWELKNWYKQEIINLWNYYCINWLIFWNFGGGGHFGSVKTSRWRNWPWRGVMSQTISLIISLYGPVSSQQLICGNYFRSPHLVHKTYKIFTIRVFAKSPI